VASLTEPSSGPVVVRAAVSDPLVEPLLRELAREYSSRYGGDARGELDRYPAEEFAPPHGVLLLLLEAGEPVAGGAFRRYDDSTAELKRIWTHSAHRRRGLARRVVAELEREAAVRGYRRIHLTTGPRQPEARGLYLATGYTPLFDTDADPETIGPLPFEKHLDAHAIRSRKA
jgi:polar amino acid transport system permease protein